MFRIILRKNSCFKAKVILQTKIVDGGQLLSKYVLSQLPIQLYPQINNEDRYVLKAVQDKKVVHSFE